VNDNTLFLRNYLDFYYDFNRQEYYLASIAAFRSLQKNHKSITALFYNITARTALMDKMTTNDQMDQIVGMLLKGEYPKSFIDYMYLRMSKKLLDIMDFIKAEDWLKRLTGWRKDSREGELSRAYILHNTGLFDDYGALMDSLYNRHSAQPVWLTAMGDIAGDWSIHRYPEADK
jgi:hypothetical protein